MAIFKDIFVKGSLMAILLVLLFAIYDIIDICSKAHGFLKKKLNFQ